MSRKAIVVCLGAAGLAAGLGALWFGVARPPSSNRLIVRNAAGVELKSVQVDLRLSGGNTLGRTLASLPPGQSLVINHEANDSTVTLRFALRESPRTHVTPYIDLWRGEGWVLEIQPDGAVKEGYDYPGFVLR
jgi:hypothetical protein